MHINVTFRLISFRTQNTVLPAKIHVYPNQLDSFLACETVCTGHSKERRVSLRLVGLLHCLALYASFIPCIDNN